MSFKKTLAIASALAIALSTSADATHYYKRIAGSQYVKNICLGFGTTVDQVYHTALSNAVSKWNTAFKGTGKTILGFKYSSSTTNSPADCTHYITVKVQDYGNTLWEAKSGFPASSGGMPYHEILLNKYWLDNQYSDQKTATIMHEIAHTIGIMHTDAGSGTSIPGTSGYDAQSLFRDLTGSAPLPVFTAKDKIAVEYLYGLILLFLPFFKIYTMNFQKKHILIFIFSLLLGGYIGYFSSIDDIDIYYTSMGIRIPFEEKMKDQKIEIRVCNNTEKDISEISIQDSIFIEKMNQKTCSEFQKVKNLYKNLAMYIYIPSEKYSQELYQTIPLDLMGAEYLKRGKYTVNISGFNTLKAPIIQHDGAIEYEIKIIQ